MGVIIFLYFLHCSGINSDIYNSIFIMVNINNTILIELSGIIFNIAVAVKPPIRDLILVQCSRREKFKVIFRAFRILNDGDTSKTRIKKRKLIPYYNTLTIPNTIQKCYGFIFKKIIFIRN